MEILITGASGFLGRQTVRMLLADGHTVYSLSRKAALHSAASLIEVRGDLLNDDWCGKVPWNRIDAVVHLAAAGVKASNRNWRDALAVNVGGTTKLLGAIKQKAAKRPRLIFARSFYEQVIRTEPTLRDNAYVATKAMSTELVKAWSTDYQGSVSFATLFQIYGPGDDPGSVLSYAAHQFAAGHQAKFGSGLGMRDWLYVDDAATAIATLIQHETIGVSEWDVGSGHLTSLREMVEKLAGFAGADSRLLNFDPALDRGDLSLQIAAQKSPPGWHLMVPIDEGLRRTLRAAKLEEIA